MRLVKFIARQGEYVFPEQSSGTLTFGDVVTSTKRLAGMDGGFDEYRDRRSPQAVGNVRSEWWINPNSSTLITSQKDTASKMQHFGKGILFVKPEESTDVKRHVRYTRARINNIQMPENVREMPHLRQKATAQFQVSDPAWYGIEPNSLDSSYNTNRWIFFNDGHKFGTSGLKFGGPRRAVTINNGDTITVINSGSHPTRPVIRITGVTSSWLLGGTGIRLGDPTLFLDGPASATPNIGMRRISYASETVVEEWRWFGTIATSDTLEIDCQKFKVTRETTTGDENAYDGFVVSKGFGFFEIPPGTHTLQIFGVFSTTASVKVYYPDAWY